MQLHQGSIYWNHSTTDRKTYPALNENIECEILIIGGGISGAFSSYFLAKNGYDVVVVERGRIGLGSTVASTGIVQFQNDIELVDCIERFGVDKGVGFYKLCKDSIQELNTLMSQQPDDTEFKMRESLYFASEPKHLKKLQYEYDALIRHGFDVDYLSQKEIESKFSFSKSGAIYSYDNAEVNPLKLVYTLFKGNSRIFENTEVNNISYHTDYALCDTNHNHTIKAKRVIFATGYATQDFERNKQVMLHTSYAITTNPLDIEGWYNRCMIWETKRPYIYLRTTRDNRIIVGGFDDPIPNQSVSQQAFEEKKIRLLNALKEMFPTLKDTLSIDYYWSGTFAETEYGLPFIGQQPGYPLSFFMLAYGGNGIVYSLIAAKIITEIISEGKSPYYDMFQFNY